MLELETRSTCICHNYFTFSHSGKMIFTIELVEERELVSFFKYSVPLIDKEHVSLLKKYGTHVFSLPISNKYNWKGTPTWVDSTLFIILFHTRKSSRKHGRA